MEHCIVIERRKNRTTVLARYNEYIEQFVTKKYKSIIMINFAMFENILVIVC